MIRLIPLVLLVAVITTPVSAASALYRCALNMNIVANYSSDAKSVTIYVQGQTLQLPIAISGSGARYSDGKTTFWEHQGQALFEAPGVSFTGCKLIRLGY